VDTGHSVYNFRSVRIVMSEVDEANKVGGDVEMADINVTVPSETDDVIKDNYSETQAEPQELSTLDSTEQQTVDARSSLQPEVR